MRARAKVACIAAATGVFLAFLPVQWAAAGGIIGVATGRGTVGANTDSNASSPSFFEVSNLRIAARVHVGGRSYQVVAQVGRIGGQGQPRRFGPMTMAPFAVSGTSAAGPLKATCSGDASADPDLVVIDANCQGSVGAAPVAGFPLGMQLEVVMISGVFNPFGVLDLVSGRVAGTVTQ